MMGMTLVKSWIRKTTFLTQLAAYIGHPVSDKVPLGSPNSETEGHSAVTSTLFALVSAFAFE